MEIPTFLQEMAAVLDNRVLIVAILACLTAQVVKPFIELAQSGKFNVASVVSSGGMPSSHSSFVTALAVGVAQTVGWDSPDFAIACVFAIIVMYDAAGVRQAAGDHARLLNQVIDELFGDRDDVNEERLKELLGHTPLQVAIGSMLGFIVSLLATAVY